MALGKKRQIIVLTTGGTIEKSYDELDGSLNNRESQIQKYVLDKLRLPYTSLQVSSVMAKDSLSMKDKDRDIIYRVIENCFEQNVPIVIIHGTDTMELTGRYCYEQNPTPPVPVIFSGAMKPVGFEDSDGRQNITEAIHSCKLLPPGWYISFHGEVFKIPNVQKNPDRGTFELISPV